jgi:Carboxypeptidase regulatory-like domain
VKVSGVGWQPRFDALLFALRSALIRISFMKKVERKLALVVVFIATLVFSISSVRPAFAQKDKDQDDDAPTAVLNFLVLKEDNGKPVRNAAIIMHSVNSKGKQGRGDLELKTDADGKTTFDGIPYGKLRVQVLAPGFQTYGEDYDVTQATMDFTVKLKRPQGQFSIYGNSSGGKKDTTAPPADPNTKPN